MPNDSKRKHDDQEAEVQVDVEAIVDGAEQKKGGGSATLFVSNLPYSGQSSFPTKFLDLARKLGGAAVWLAECLQSCLLVDDTDGLTLSLLALYP